MQKFLLFMLCTVLCLSTAVAQKTTAIGKVIDSSGAPVPSATIVEKGARNNSVRANEDGEFTILVNAKARLQISAVGFETKELSAENAAHVTLKAFVENLSEVVVTALGMKREKKALGFSIQSVSGDNLTFSNGVDISSALAGKIAGVKLLGSPSSTFDNASISIRGPKGFGVTSPLFVLDGNVVDQSVVNMDNIENISVLKGGTAAALYGQRATNGVVVLTSKKGKRGTGVPEIEVRTGVSFEKLNLRLKYQNEYAGGYSSSVTSPGDSYDDSGWYKFEHDPAIHPAGWASWNGQNLLEYGADESWGPRIDGTTQYRPWYSWYDGDPRFGKTEAIMAHPNNITDLFRTGRTITNTVAVTTSGNNYNMRFTYNNQDRTLINYNSRRMLHQIGLNGSFDINKWFSLTSDIQYSYDDRLGQPFETYRNDGLNVTQGVNQWFQRQLDTKGMKENYYAPDGRVNSWNIGDPNATGSLKDITTSQYWDNPWFVIFNNYRTNKSQRLSANLGLHANLAKGLKLSTYVRRSTNGGASDFKIGTGGLEKDAYGVSQYQYAETNYESNLTYHKKINDFSMDLLAGMNIRKSDTTSVSVSTNGGLTLPNLFTVRASRDKPNYSNSISRIEVWSHYARASVGYEDFLFLDLTIRRDASSTLPIGNNVYTYSSASTSFVFSELFKSSPVYRWLNYGKLRGGMAKTGSDIGFAQVNTSILSESPFNGITGISYGNVLRRGNIKPALQTAYEAGLELKLFNTLGIDFTYYQNINENQILNVNLSAANGFNSAQVNAGRIENKGWELALTPKVLLAKDFIWEGAFNVAKQTNKVVEIADDLKVVSYGTTWNDTKVEHQEGKSWGVLLGRKWDIDPKNGLPIIGTNGIPTYTTGNEVGNILPDFTGGSYNTFTYKSFNLSFSIDYQKGGLFFSTTRMFGLGTGLSSETVGVNDKGNDIRSFPSLGGGVKVVGSDGSGNERIVYVPARRWYYTILQREITNFLFDASYVKMRDIRLGYTMSGKLAKKILYAKSINFSLFVSNPWLIYAESKKFGIDPSELEETWSEGGQLSQTSQLGFSLKVRF